MLATTRGIDGCPNIVLIGVPDTAALRRVEAKLIREGIAHFNWEEPDFDLGFTAISTEPLSQERKLALANYRLWKPCSAVARLAERPAA